MDEARDRNDQGSPAERGDESLGGGVGSAGGTTGGYGRWPPDTEVPPPGYSGYGESEDADTGVADAGESTDRGSE